MFIETEHLQNICLANLVHNGSIEHFISMEFACLQKIPYLCIQNCIVIIYRSPVLLNKMQSKQDKNTIIIPDEISYWQEYLS